METIITNSLLIMILTVLFSDKFVHTNKKELIPEEEENEKESREPDYDEDKDQLEERQGELAQGKQIINQVAD